MIKHKLRIGEPVKIHPQTYKVVIEHLRTNGANVYTTHIISIDYKSQVKRLINFLKYCDLGKTDHEDVEKAYAKLQQKCPDLDYSNMRQEDDADDAKDSFPLLESITYTDSDGVEYEVEVIEKYKCQY